MADQKISELTALTGANVADDDAIAIVDTSATETKKIVFSELKNALDTATGFVRITGDTMTGNLSMGDNVKAIFGAGSDLQIYHDGQHSRIQDVGAGDLILSAENDLRLETYTGNVPYINCNYSDSVQLAFNGDWKLATTSTGVDITGTLTADDVSIADTSPTLLFNRTDRATDNKIIRFAHDGEDFQLQLANDAVSSVTPAIAINRTGMSLDSIAFYEDTGTTPKFFWDASDQDLTITPNLGNISIKAGTHDATNNVRLEAGGTTSTYLEYRGYLGHIWDVNTTEAMRIDSSGNVMVGGTVAGNAGTISLNVGDVGSTNGGLQLWGTTTGTHYIQFGDESGTAANHYRGYIAYAHNGDSLRFGTASTEAMRIDSSGNAIIGGTLAGQDGAVTLSNTGYIQARIDNDTVAYFDRTGAGDDGEVIRIQQNGSTVGSIGTNGSTLYIGSGEGTDAYLGFGNQIIRPVTSTGASRDNAIDLGYTGMRFKDLYLSGGTITGAFSSTGASAGKSVTGSGRLTESSTASTTSKTHRAFYNPNGQVGTIATSGSATAYNTSSDYRLKTDAQPMTGATDRIKQLNPVNFEWIADGTRVDGFLAHEAQAVVPEAVTGTKDAMRDEEYEVTPAVLDDDGNVVTEAVMGTRSVPDYQGIDQGKLVPLLVATIKELEARITALENA